METYFDIHDELGINQVEEILKNNLKLRLSRESQIEIKNCRTYLDQKIERSVEPIYGVNTGFGSLCDTKISPQDLTTLQENLLKSHACGTGEFVKIEIIRLMLLLKIQSLSFANSGVCVETIERLMAFFNEEVYPVVYDQGSLGASGDLAPLAHLTLPLIGEGEVWVKQNGEYKRVKTASIMQEYGWEPLKLKSKEGLALINGTQFMSAYGVYIWLKSQHLLVWSLFIAANSIDGFEGRPEPFHPALHRLRPFPGQVEAARIIRFFLKDSEITLEPKKQVQDPYSFRCIPQVMGASMDAFGYFKNILLMEINSVTDNPNILPEIDKIISGGNFHGQPLALAFDFWAMGLSEVGNISERRIFQLISGSRGLPPFLTNNAGLNSGFMIPQYTAASIVSQNKQLCTPCSVDSIVSSNGQEDHVSMGANAATKLLRVLENVEKILAIEYMTATQAIEFRRPLKSSNLIEEKLIAYRKSVAHLGEDRILFEDIQKTISFIQNTELTLSINNQDEIL